MNQRARLACPRARDDQDIAASMDGLPLGGGEGGHGISFRCGGLRFYFEHSILFHPRIKPANSPVLAPLAGIFVLITERGYTDIAVVDLPAILAEEILEEIDQAEEV